MAWSADFHKPNHIENEEDLHFEAVVAGLGGGRKDVALADFSHIFQVRRTVCYVLEQIEPEVERIGTAGQRDVELHRQTSDIVVVFRDGIVETWTNRMRFAVLVLCSSFFSPKFEHSVKCTQSRTYLRQSE